MLVETEAPPEASKAVGAVVAVVAARAQLVSHEHAVAEQ